MAVSIGKEVAALKRLAVTELRGKYAEVVRRIAWRLQANAEGDLSERARQRAKDLARNADVRLTPPKRTAPPASGPTAVSALHISQDDRLPMPGALITREYKGRTVEVYVLPDGFEYEGEVYRTLSAVARAVTGTHWNGYHFFRLNQNGKRP